MTNVEHGISIHSVGSSTVSFPPQLSPSSYSSILTPSSIVERTSAAEDSTKRGTTLPREGNWDEFTLSSSK